VDGNSRALEDAVKLGYFEVIGVETYGGLSGEGKVESLGSVKMTECAIRPDSFSIYEGHFNIPCCDLP
jgi:hypothetical protein